MEEPKTGLGTFIWMQKENQWISTGTFVLRLGHIENNAVLKEVDHCVQFCAPYLRREHLESLDKQEIGELLKGEQPNVQMHVWGEVITWLKEVN